MLLARALVGFIFLFLVVAGVLFGLAGTLHDGRLGDAGGVLRMRRGHHCLALVPRRLLERRVKAAPGSEADPMQNVIQGLAGLVFLATFAVPGLDRRFGRVPTCPSPSRSLAT